MIGRGKVKWHKCQPNNTSRIHGETNVLTLIKCFGNFSCQHRINGAYDNEEDGKEEGDHVGGIDVRVADQVVVFARRVVMLGMRWRNQHPYHIYEHLKFVKFLKLLTQKFLAKFLTCIDIRKLQMMSCDLGEMNDGRLAVCLPALKILAIRFVFVSRAA
jgi:hypothetical protein